MQFAQSTSNDGILNPFLEEEEEEEEEETAEGCVKLRTVTWQTKAKRVQYFSKIIL